VRRFSFEALKFIFCKNEFQCLKNIYIPFPRVYNARTQQQNFLRGFTIEQKGKNNA